jgi:hypothetical protein
LVQGLTKDKVLDPNHRPPQLLARDVRGRLGWSQSFYERTFADQRLRIKLLDVGDGRGRVVDAAGAPIAKARLTLLFLTRDAAPGAYGETTNLTPELAKDYGAETGADGFFTIGKLPTQASIMANVSAPGFGMPRVKWDCANPPTDTPWLKLHGCWKSPFPPLKKTCGSRRLGCIPG